MFYKLKSTEKKEDCPSMLGQSSNYFSASEMLFEAALLCRNQCYRLKAREEGELNGLPIGKFHG